MLLANAPGKLVLPFAISGNRRPIPAASQIGITAGAASLTDGFPPLTQTPLAAGGVPVSPLDMNGIFYELSAIIRWANAGGGYVYDGTFAADVDVGGYPKGARVLRSDGVGYWLNTADNNVTDPEGAGAVAAGWVPDFTNGVAAITMTGSNVTLTALQYGKPIIIISGLLTADLNLIFPDIAGEWAIINNTTGAFTITAKTAAGTGVAVSGTSNIVGDATNIYQAGGGISQAAADARYLQLSGAAAMTGKFVQKVGANIASAATVNLATATGNTVHITGTTGTTAVTMTAGAWVRTIADAAWPLTYHATNCKLNTGGANYTCSAGDSILWFYDGIIVYGWIDPASGLPVLSQPVVSVRQTVLSGPVDSNGFSAFGGSTGSTTVTAAGTLKATAAAGGDANYSGSITNPSWTGLSTNGAMYLYLDIDAAGNVTTGSTALQPNYQWGGAYSTTNLQNTFNIQEMTMKMGNGSSATQVYRVFVGEVAVAGGVVTAIIWYALKGQYESALTSTLPGTGTAIAFAHNIGTNEGLTTQLFVENITPEGNFSAGDRLIPNTNNGTASAPFTPSWDRKTVTYTTNSGTAFQALNKTSGAGFVLTAANWKYGATAKRKWN